MPAISRLDCVSECQPFPDLTVYQNPVECLVRYWMPLLDSTYSDEPDSSFHLQQSLHMNMRVVSQSFGTGRLDPFEGESNTCKSNLQGLNYFKIVKEAKIGI